MEVLKQEFRNTNDRNKKIQILTIFNGWSFCTIQKTFNASNHMITVAKKTAEEYGILPTPDVKTGKKLDKATVDCIVDFYTSDLISCVMAGKKNYLIYG